MPATMAAITPQSAPESKPAETLIPAKSAMTGIMASMTTSQTLNFICLSCDEDLSPDLFEQRGARWFLVEINLPAHG